MEYIRAHRINILDSLLISKYCTQFTTFQIHKPNYSGRHVPLKLCFRTALRSSVSWTSYKDQLQPECSSHTLSQVLHLYQKKFSYDLNRFNKPYKMGLLCNGLWTKSSLRKELRVRVSVVLTFLSEN